MGNGVQQPAHHWARNEVHIVVIGNEASDSSQRGKRLSRRATTQEGRPAAAFKEGLETSDTA